MNRRVFLLGGMGAVSAPRVKLTAAELWPVRATPRTVWLLIQLRSDTGVDGLGEASDAFGIYATTVENVAAMRTELTRQFGLLAGRSPFDVEYFRQTARLRIFDRASVEIDRTQLYTVDDPDDLLHREPLVGWFRVRGPPPDQAFTFSLINIHTDPDEVQHEINVLDDVFRAVRDDGRGEDDVILLGDLNADDRHLGQLGQIPGIRCVILNMNTNTHT